MLCVSWMGIAKLYAELILVISLMYCYETVKEVSLATVEFGEISTYYFMNSRDCI